MDIQNFKNWVIELKEVVPFFVKNMEDKNIKGKYKLSMSGDLAPIKQNWGLAQTTFATRILYILDAFTPNIKRNLKEFIFSFEHKNGSIYDGYVQKKTRYKRWLQGIKNKNIDILLNKTNIRAETRQAIAALINLKEKPHYYYKIISYSEKSIKNYIDKLAWEEPWGAASHINHLIFFIVYNSNQNKENQYRIIKIIKKQVSKYINFTYADIPEILKIGGMMKILMGFSLIETEKEWISEHLVDLCLKNTLTDDACVNFNTIFVLSKCLLHINYRKDESINFLLRAADTWKNVFFKEKEGGFSFYQNKSASLYYGAELTKGLNEPDLHGTAMFIWGVYIISEVLGIDKELKICRPLL